jgi:hypothetical protein
MSSLNILSFDIGIKNLAFCLFQYDLESSYINFDIIEWDVINLVLDGDKSLDHDTLFIELNERFGDTKIDYIIIENQPAMKNPIMKTIQVMVYSYFKQMQLLHNKDILDVKMCNASNKIRYAKKLIPISEIELKTPESNTYKRNKEAAIAYTLYLLNLNNKNDDISFFKTFKKKDDLADTLLQGLYFCSTLTSTSKTLLPTLSDT